MPAPRFVRRLVCFATALVLPLVAVACGGSGGLPGGRTAVVIGFPASLTGANAAIGQGALNALQLFRDWVNERGGIQVAEFGRRLPIELLTGDDQSDRDRAVELCGQFLTGADFLLASYTSGLTGAQAPLAEAAGKLIFAWGASSDNLWQQGYRTLIGVLTPASRYEQTLLEHLAGLAPRPTRLALLVKDDPFTTTVADGAEAAAPGLGYTVVARQTYAPAATEFGAQLAALAAADPEVVLVECHLPDGLRVARAIAELADFPAELVAYSSAPAAATWGDSLGALAEGTAGVSQWEPTMALPAGALADPRFFGPALTPAQWREQYVARFGVEPDFRAMAVFASGLALTQAIETAGSLATEAVREALIGLDQLTCYGRFQLEPTTLNQVGSPMKVIQWQAGQKVIVAPTDVATGTLVFPAR